MNRDILEQFSSSVGLEHSDYLEFVLIQLFDILELAPQQE